jgi:hypothetical protein
VRHQGRCNEQIEYVIPTTSTRSSTAIGGKSRIPGVVPSNVRYMKTEEEKQTQAKVSKQRLSEEEGIPARPEEIVKLNHEYGRIICVGEECMKAIPLSMLGKHLGMEHNVPKGATAKFIDSIGKGAWGRRRRKGTPADGLEPQKGIRILDGYRCRHCDVFRARSAGSVEDH